MGSTVFQLEDDEVTMTEVNLCGKYVSKRPYGDLGHVDRSNCLCCVSVTSAFGPIAPGCGCSESRVDEIVQELRERVKSRGDAAQIRRSEETLERLDAKLNALMEFLRIPKTKSMQDRE